MVFKILVFSFPKIYFFFVKISFCQYHKSVTKFEHVIFINKFTCFKNDYYEITTLTGHTVFPPKKESRESVTSVVVEAFLKA